MHKTNCMQSIEHISTWEVFSSIYPLRKKMNRNPVQQCGMCDQQSLRLACANAKSDLRLCLSLEYSMSVELLTEHNFEFLHLRGGCTGSSESTLVKMPHYCKSHAAVQLVIAKALRGQTARIHRLVCAFVLHKHRRGPKVRVFRLSKSSFKLQPT